MTYGGSAGGASLISAATDRAPLWRPVVGLRLILMQRPILAAVLFSGAWLAGGELIYSGLDWLTPDAPYVTRSLVRAVSSAAAVAALLTALGWWQRVGLAWRPSATHLVYLAVPLALEIAPLAVHGLAWRPGAALDPAVAGLWAMWALLVAFAEEGMWRGVLLQALAPSGATRAVVISALAFGLTHLGSVAFGWPLVAVLPMVALTMGLGIMSGALVLRLATLWPVILLHAGYDFLCLCPALHATRGMCGGVALAFLVIGLAAAAYGLVLLRLPRVASVSWRLGRGGSSTV